MLFCIVLFDPDRYYYSEPRSNGNGEGFHILQTLRLEPHKFEVMTSRRVCANLNIYIYIYIYIVLFQPELEVIPPGQENHSKMTI